MATTQDQTTVTPSPIKGRETGVVALLDAGERKVSVIKEVRQHLGWSLKNSFDFIEQDEPRVVFGLSPSTARALVDGLMRVGATAQVAVWENDQMTAYCDTCDQRRQFSLESEQWYAVEEDVPHVHVRLLCDECGRVSSMAGEHERILDSLLLVDGFVGTPANAWREREAAADAEAQRHYRNLQRMARMVGLSLRKRRLRDGTFAGYVLVPSNTMRGLAYGDRLTLDEVEQKLEAVSQERRVAA